MSVLIIGLLTFYREPAKEPKEQTKSIVGESRLQIHPARYDAFWIDDQTLIFAAADNGAGEITGPYDDVFSFPKEKVHMYVWKMGDSPKPYKLGAWPEPGTQVYQNYLCAFNDEIFYSVKADPTRDFTKSWTAMIMQGPLGKEKLVEFRKVASEEWSPPLSFDPVGRRCDQLHVPQMKGRSWKGSYFGDLVLDFGPLDDREREGAKDAASNGRVLSLISRGSVSIALKIDAPGVSALCTRTPSWENVFLVQPCVNDIDWSSANSFPVWKVDSLGNVRGIDVPTGAFIAPEVVPFRRGSIVIGSYSKETSEDARQQLGIYYASQGQLKLILKGNYRALAISPNGCLGAFAKATLFGFGTSRERILVLDLCKI
ncbi:MAG TPA: hypothetical protein VJM79_02855 [Rhizorhapis sp.]|nr:hypothetical protein [Rhizorhapis sp.]